MVLFHSQMGHHRINIFIIYKVMKYKVQSICAFLLKKLSRY